MSDTHPTRTTTTRGLSRRAVTRGALWAAPTLVVTSAAPAMAASLRKDPGINGWVRASWGSELVGWWPNRYRRYTLTVNSTVSGVQTPDGAPFGLTSTTPNLSTGTRTPPLPTGSTTRRRRSSGPHSRGIPLSGPVLSRGLLRRSQMAIRIPHTHGLTTVRSTRRAPTVTGASGWGTSMCRPSSGSRTATVQRTSHSGQSGRSPRSGTGWRMSSPSSGGLAGAAPTRARYWQRGHGFEEYGDRAGAIPVDRRSDTGGGRGDRDPRKQCHSLTRLASRSDR